MACDKNPQKIKNMFDDISSYYDRMNTFISFGLHVLIKKNAVKMLNTKPNSYILDLCCGTGDFTKILTEIQPKSKVIGLDISQEMIKLAKNKNPQKPFLSGDCTNLPFKENEFDYVTVGFGLRNIENRSKALSQVYRVLKPGGKFLHLDFGYHNFLNKIFCYLVPLIIKIMNKSTESYSYLLKSISEYPEPDELIKEFETEGFKFLEKRDYLFGAISAQIMIK